MSKVNSEFEKFSSAMDKLLKVSHDELKKQLDAEKAAKRDKKRVGNSRARKSAGS